jgi:hypothetical protein
MRLRCVPFDKAGRLHFRVFQFANHPSRREAYGNLAGIIGHDRGFSTALNI